MAQTVSIHDSNSRSVKSWFVNFAEKLEDLELCGKIPKLKKNLNLRTIFGKSCLK